MAKNPRVRDMSEQFYNAGELMALVQESDDLEQVAPAGEARRAPVAWLLLAGATAVGFVVLACLSF